MHQPPHKYKPSGTVMRVSRIKPWRIPIPPEMSFNPKHRPLSLAILIYGFAGIIALGAILLALPISSKNGEFTPFIDALFTATSAVCVTGLNVMPNTSAYFSPFGQLVILILIQIGGFGFMTSATLLLIALGRRIGLRQRLVIAESLGMSRTGGVILLIKQYALIILVIEAGGAALLYVSFSNDSPFWTALWHSVFQSVSAFNNAGFSVVGGSQGLIPYQNDALVLLVTAGLIFLGGISFILMADVFKNWSFARLSLDSKLVIVTTIILLGLGTIVILISEYTNADTLGPLSFGNKLLVAFFQSVTPRTAGFQAIDMGLAAEYTLFFTIILMFFGGASGSTAGGIKVNTVGMLSATMWSSLTGKENAGAFGREFQTQNIYRAMALVMLALGFVCAVVLVLSTIEDFSFLKLLFETVSAFGTVGLSTGITPYLTAAGKLIIIVTMFIGRLGPLTLALVLVQRQKPSTHRYPYDSVRIG
ncbi:MAG: TrkH family potassium uptake protein [Dehalococcoidia bacterium]